MSAAHSLIWDDYSKDIETGFCEIYKSGILHDVTLTAEGQKLTAHKLILALSSSHFKELFSDNSSQNQQTIVFISDISFRALKLLVEFMYTGEISVPEDLLQEVLKGAKNFHMKALMDKQELENNEELPEKQASPTSDCAKRSKRISRVPFRYQYDTKDKKRKIENTENKPVLYMDINGCADVNNDTQSNNSFFENDPICLQIEPDILDAADAGEFEDIGLEADVNETSNSEPQDTKDNIVLLSEEATRSILKYIRNKNGNLCLVVNDHIFLKQTVHKTKIFWRCQMHNKLGCKSRCITDGSIITRKVALHNHAPQTEKVIQCEINGEIVYM